MSFRNYRLCKTWLNKCLKSPVSDALRQATWFGVPNTVKV